MLDNTTNADIVDAFAMRDKLAAAIRVNAGPVGGLVADAVAEYLITEGLIDLGALYRTLDEE